MHDAGHASTWPQPAPLAAQPSSALHSATHVHAWKDTTNLHKPSFASYATRVASLAQTERNARVATLLSSFTPSTRVICVHALTSHTLIPLKASVSIAISSAKHARIHRRHFAPVAILEGRLSIMIVPVCLFIMTPGPQALARLVITVA